jgi:hydrogenase nickel incorporation protein HypA/HybF
MHESHQVQRLIGEARQWMETRQIAKPRRVTVLMGELLGFDAVSVGLHWEELTAGTPLEGAALTVETVPARLNCPQCGVLFPKRGSNLSCPSCQVLGTPTPAGREFCIKEITP